MLQIAPELVRMQVAQNFMSASADRSNNYEILGDGKSAKLGWHIQDYNPLGAVGDAKSATAEKGEKLLQSAGFQLAKLLQELITMPPLSVRS